MPPLKKIVLLLFLGAMLATVTTPALALMCLASHSAKECAEVCGVDMWFMFLRRRNIECEQAILSNSLRQGITLPGAVSYILFR